MTNNSDPPPLDPQTQRDLREFAQLIMADTGELAELVIADALVELLESDALDVEAEVDAMFRGEP